MVAAGLTGETTAAAEFAGDLFPSGVHKPRPQIPGGRQERQWRRRPLVAEAAAGSTGVSRRAGSCGGCLSPWLGRRRRGRGIRGEAACAMKLLANAIWIGAEEGDDVRELTSQKGSGSR